MKITIEIDGSYTEEEIRGLLQDALGEWKFNRSPEEDYVERRYGFWPEHHRKVKIQEVKNKIILASKILVGSIKVE